MPFYFHCSTKSASRSVASGWAKTGETRSSFWREISYYRFPVIELRQLADAHRHYAICLGCHSMKYIDICPVHSPDIDDFTVTGHKLEIYGYCNKCENMALFYLLLFFPALWFIWAQGAKRCHDRGNSGWYQLIPFYALWMFFGEGEECDNEYGSDPKGRDIFS